MSKVVKLRLVRGPQSTKCIIGKLYWDDRFICYTLEDVARPVKIMHETCIPKGTYKIIVNMSNRFKKLMPLLLDVPGFEGIRIHCGNTDKDTSGCILVGKSLAKDFIGDPKLAFDELMQILNPGKEVLQCTIEIV